MLVPSSGRSSPPLRRLCLTQWFATVGPLLVLAATSLSGCNSPPALSALDPPSGHPHDVVLVQGTDLEFAQIVWDAGTTSEHVIPGGFLGAFMFSVPHDALPGNHVVALRNSAGLSKQTLTFQIPMTPGPLDVPRPPGPSRRPFPKPRIDSVMILGATFDASGVTTTLYVQGANLDIGATVSVQTEDEGGPRVEELPSLSHKVLRNYWYGVSGAEFDYPIYHYTSTLVVAGTRPPGQPIKLVVKNLDSVESDPFEYVLPNTPDTLDSDGDNLADVWETDGYDPDKDGVLEVDLKSLGADPYRRDLFLELDIMDPLLNPPDRDVNGNPDSTVFDSLRQMFASAPIINVGGAPGINLVIDASGKPCLIQADGSERCSFQTTVFNVVAPSGPLSPNQALFSDLKARSFDNARRGNIYHYAIWGDQMTNRSGRSDFADDFLIAFDWYPSSYQTVRSKTEILAHELGHDLSQLHGGGGDFPEYSPNYLSVMSYSWMFRTGWPNNTSRQDYVTCLPLYYASPGAAELSGAVPASVNSVVDYSQGMAKTLTPPVPPTSGPTVFCGKTVVWSTVLPTSTIGDFGNWRALTFDGPVRNGGILP